MNLNTLNIEFECEFSFLILAHEKILIYHEFLILLMMVFEYLEEHFMNILRVSYETF